MIKVLTLLLLLPFAAWSQTVHSDSTATEAKEVKTGANIGLLPVVAYDADLGLQYGGLANLFLYGDGSSYPMYKHSIYGEISRYTRGSGINRLFYDSWYLIPGLRVTADLSYLTEQAYAFYGFNGAESVFNATWMDDQSADYRSRMFYRHARERVRILIDFQGRIIGDKLRWIAGFTHLNDRISSVDIDQLNEGKTDDLLPSVEAMPGLYERYVAWGVIPENEADGGINNYLKLGFIWDTRDNEPNPMRGMWSEALLFSAPGFLINETPHHILNLTHRQYFTLIPRDLSLAIRLMAQQTISGSAPFYVKPNVVTSFQRGVSSDGIGGGKTVRGVLLNRIVGNGVFMGNVEMRWKVWHFRLLNNNFYLGLNAFLDAGQVIKPVDMNFDQLPEDYDSFFNDSGEKMHFGTGLGFRVAMNQNFVVALDYGFALDSQDGDQGMYIGLNYLF
mgnify:CR=1 FL=1